MQRKLLVIGQVWPEPTSSAASGHMCDLLHVFLDHHWQITFASSAQPGEHMLDLPALGIATQNIAVNDSRFDQFVAELAPDVVLFDRFTMEEQFGWRVEQACPESLRIIETVDLHCLREGRHLAAKAKREGREADCVNDVALREIASMFRADLSLMVSEVEIDILRRRFSMPGELLHYCPLLVDNQLLTTIRPNLPGYAERQDFMTIGNFRHAPNWDSVLWLKQEIWPLIRRQLPQAQLHIYGSYAPPKATALHNPREGFLVHGRAEDALKVMQQARICLAPLRFGAGIKGKLLDAMQSGTPSVTTAIGAEAMHGSPGHELPWPGLLAEHAQAFADAAVHLHQDQALWQQAQAQGFHILQQVFDKHAHAEKLLKRLQALTDSREDERAQNFIGAMLRHHHHRSTEFMSRWIEAKNRLVSTTSREDNHE